VSGARCEHAVDGRAGCVQLRRARSTGTLVGVYDGEQAGLDTDDGASPWSTVCEEHSTCVSHRTLALARDHAAAPEGWCEDCVPRRQERVPCDVCKGAGTCMLCDDNGTVPAPREDPAAAGRTTV
jgi:hypothetical protein